MSLEPTANLQLFSPTGSGRSSPSPRTTRSTTEEALYKKDKHYRRYASGVERALALWDTAQQEWADYISFLARLLKALQAHPSEIPVIPHCDAVALRLAQCLNPALPSGVHQKALEVYGYIFSTIGKDALARDLSLYFPGLASVPSFASLSVRPLFLSIFESYILKLDGTALRPALKAVILCLLPGLEDESSEDFERMVAALDKLRHAVKSEPDEITSARNEPASSHFWQAFFLATITNPSRRQGALAFLVRRLPKFGLPSRHGSISSDAPAEGLSAEAEAALLPEPGLLIRCFESGLSDPQILIQRGFLDLLVTHLPLDAPVLQQRTLKADLERLVAAAASVVSRRDMSLNRRLWAWFLGPEPSGASEAKESVVSPTQESAMDGSAHQAAYFSNNGLRALTRSIMKMVNRPSKHPVERARPFRVCLSLMDRWEVGGLIVPEVFLPALQSIQSYSEAASKDQVDEVMRSASAFFDGVDSGLIWGKLIHLVTSSLDPEQTSQEESLRRIKLAKFVLARFNLKEEEMLVYHMPLMILTTLSSLNTALEDSMSKVKFSRDVLDLAFEIADSLTQLVPDRALKNPRADDNTPNSAVNVRREIVLQKTKAFYDETQGNLDVADPPFGATDLGQFILRESSRMFAGSLHSGSATSADMPSRILSNLVFKIQDLAALDQMDPFSVFQQVLVPDSPKSNQKLPFPHLSAITVALLALQTARPSHPFLSASQLSEVVHPLIASLWQYLSPLMPKYHVEAVRCILQLHAISPTNQMVEAAISSIIVHEPAHSNSSTNAANNGRRFAVLWTHTMHELSLQSEKRGGLSRRVSGIGAPPPPILAGGFHLVLTRPLLLLLDSLAEDETETSSFVRSWIQDLPSLNKVFEVLAIHIQSLNCLASGNSLAPGAAPQLQRHRKQVDDTRECLYYLKHIHNILKRPSHYTWATLAEELAPVTQDSPTKTFLQEWLVQTCLRTLSIDINATGSSRESHLQDLYRTSIMIIAQVYQSPFATSLRDLELEVPLMARLRTATPSLQSLLLDAILSALKLRLTGIPEEPPQDLKPLNHGTQRSRLSTALNRDSEEVEPASIPPPPQLVDCLKYGFSSLSSRLVLEDWVHFLIEVLPLFADAIFQNLLPLVETFCKQINMTFVQLKTIFSTPKITADISPESTLISLINGLEQILAKAHDRLMIQETQTTANKSPEVQQGFFGNMVSGVFAAETNQKRTPTANSRLTVLLCFQDTVRICFEIWSWGGYGPKDGRQDVTSVSSFGYTSLRMRNRARRILEHLFTAEALECLETLAVLWAQAPINDTQATAIMGLLNVLNGSKPKHTIPAIFNAVYSRTNPNALDPNRMSTLTSDLADTDLVSFLVDYTKSLEDDAMDEIWQDCSLFLRDVLANPLPHRQILPSLLEFTSVIGQKVDNTNFGEQRRMRKELADIFTRILTAVFTTRSMGFLQDPTHVMASEKASATTTNSGLAQKRAADVVSILTSIIPHLPIILVENDRVANVVTTISTSVIGPTIRSKSFPENVSKSILDLLHGLAKVSQANKFWKKDIFDAFNDPRFFSTPLLLLKESWLPILAQWAHADKDRLPELLSRLSAPTTAGIMFGVGAASARQEADRKTQLTLKRIALLILASPEDTFTPNLPSITEKLVELQSATPASSPSSITRAEVLVLLRALVIKTSSIHLASLWPIVNSELTSALSSLLPDADNKEHYNNAGLIQACKLLDQLIVLDPDEFQLIQWLYISDTIDAVYKPTTSTHPPSLCDEIADILASSDATHTHRPRASLTMSISHLTSSTDALGDELATENAGGETPTRKLFLDPLIDAAKKEESAEVTDMARRELVTRILRPFLGGLGIAAFEATYGGGVVDWEGIWGSVIRDARGVE